ARTPPSSTVGFLTRHAAFCAMGSHATSSPVAGGIDLNFAFRGPSYNPSRARLERSASYFHLGLGTCRNCVPTFADRYTSPVVGLNAMGFQLCAPSGLGETITGLSSAVPGDSTGRPVLGSSPVAQV